MLFATKRLLIILPLAACGPASMTEEVRIAFAGISCTENVVRNTSGEINVDLYRSGGTDARIGFDIPVGNVKGPTKRHRCQEILDQATAAAADEKQKISVELELLVNKLARDRSDTKLLIQHNNDEMEYMKRLDAQTDW